VHERLSRRNASSTGLLLHLERSRECSRGSLATRRLTRARCSPWCCRALGYSMTSSALARSVDGTSTPRAFAVFRLITSSSLVGCCLCYRSILPGCGCAAALARRAWF
jgi:hypothetical protein